MDEFIFWNEFALRQSFIHVLRRSMTILQSKEVTIKLKYDFSHA